MPAPPVSSGTSIYHNGTTTTGSFIAGAPSIGSLVIVVSLPGTPAPSSSFASNGATGGGGVGGQTTAAPSDVGAGDGLVGHAPAPSAPDIRYPSIVVFNPSDASSQEAVATTAFVAPSPARAVAPAPEAAETATTAARNATSPLGTTSAAATATTLVGVVPGAILPATVKGNSNAGAAVSELSLALLGGASGGQAVFDGNGGTHLAMDRSLAVSGGRLAEPYSGEGVPGSGGRGKGAGAEARAGTAVRESTLVELEVPAPQRSDLITDFRPFDRAAVEQAIDRFLQQFEDLGVGLSRFQGPTDVLVELLAVAVALTAWKVVPKMLGRSREEDAELVAVDVATSLDGISGLPGSWSPEES
jgi:hypothetical protein